MGNARSSVKKTADEEFSQNGEQQKIWKKICGICHSFAIVQFLRGCWCLPSGGA
jgi:hypothetical protein